MAILVILMFSPRTLACHDNLAGIDIARDVAGVILIVRVGWR
jgi:hypothetical protein